MHKNGKRVGNQQIILVDLSTDISQAFLTKYDNTIGGLANEALSPTRWQYQSQV
jgi:hypothetical protein